MGGPDKNARAGSKGSRGATSSSSSWRQTVAMQTGKCYGFSQTSTQEYDHHRAPNDMKLKPKLKYKMCRLTW